MQAEITKILAYGTYKRYMWIKIDEKVQCFRIDNETYHYLKQKGVPTAQSMRKRQ